MGLGLFGGSTRGCGERHVFYGDDRQTQLFFLVLRAQLVNSSRAPCCPSTMPRGRF